MFVWKPLRFRTLLAAGLLAGAVGTAAPAAAMSPYAADLTVSMTSLPTSSIASGANMIYSLTVKNLATTHQVCEVIDSWPRPRTVCTTEPIGTAASGVVVQQTLPSGFAYRYSVQDHAFNCSASSATVTCSNGFLDWGDTASHRRLRHRSNARRRRCQPDPRRPPRPSIPRTRFRSATSTTTPAVSR
jgi:hypothetical protein